MTGLIFLSCGHSVRPQGPHSPILMNWGGGGVWQRFIFYTPKNHNFRICLPKKITTFFSIHKNIPWSYFRNPKKSLCFSSRPKKILSSFLDHFWPKFQTQKNHLDPPPPPPVIKICEWDPWVCSSAECLVNPNWVNPKFTIGQFVVHGKLLCLPQVRELNPGKSLSCIPCFRNFRNFVLLNGIFWILRAL